MFKRSLIQLLILGFIVSLPTGWVVAADKSSASKVSRADENFVKDAAAGGMMEVELGKMAAEKAAWRWRKQLENSSSWRLSKHGNFPMPRFPVG